MIIDVDVGQVPQHLSARYCVVGSGMGGSSIVQELVRAGRDVLLVEAGGTTRGYEPDSLVSAETIGRTFGIPVSRCIELGGTSNQWHGICGPLDDSDFVHRSWIKDSGWPIAKADLATPYRQAARMLGVDASDARTLDGSRSSVESRIHDLDFDHSLLTAKLVFHRTPPVRWKASLIELARRGRIRCLLHAPALELVTSPDGADVLELIVGAHEKVIRIKADIFIISAGALETPRLLLNSRRTIPEGLGNAGDMLGRCLMDHPAGHFCKIRFQRPLRAPLFAGMKFHSDVNVMAGLMVSPQEQQRRSFPNNYVWVRPSFTAARMDDKMLKSFLDARRMTDLSIKQIVAILGNRDLMYRVLAQRLAMKPSFRFGDMFFMTEQIPNRTSRVRLSQSVRDRFGYPIAAIDWRLAKQDLESFHSYSKFLFHEGLCTPQHSMGRQDGVEIWDQVLSSAAHHLGTVRMSDSPDHGVVDKNLKVFGLSNLYVCDGSVFPTAGAVNPALTITALGIRLATHLVSIQPH